MRRRRALLSASSGNGEGPNDAPVDVNYLTIEALEDGLTVSLSLNACEYCVDGDREWRTLEAATNTISVNTGQTLSFKGRLLPVEDFGIGTFTISKKCNLKGNCMSMLFDDYAAYNDLQGRQNAFCSLFRNCPIVSVSSNFLPGTHLTSGCYEFMFEGCTSLTTAPELHATTLAERCYKRMFFNCWSLINAPALPAMALADECYYFMFCGCTSLTVAPSLPATRLALECYSGMFDNCTGLIVAPELPATTLAHSCYMDMFNGCINLTTAPELPATTLAAYCYWSMFIGCTNLITAPELPATTLVPGCYLSMFRYCSKLNYIKMLAIDISARDCLALWTQNVSSTGTFVKNPAMTILPTGVDGIPSGWTVVNNGDE